MRKFLIRVSVFQNRSLTIEVSIPQTCNQDETYSLQTSDYLLSRLLVCLVWSDLEKSHRLMESEKVHPFLIDLPHQSSPFRNDFIQERPQRRIVIYILHEDHICKAAPHFNALHARNPAQVFKSPNKADNEYDRRYLCNATTPNTA